MRSKFTSYWKAGAFALLLAAWVSIPALTSGVKADSMPILVRTAILNSPTGSVDPHGEAEWQLYASGDRELEVEVEDLDLAQGTVLTAFINGASVGTLTVDDREKAKLKLRTEDGQTVPEVNAGSTVEVRNGDTVLVAGVFDGVTPTGSGTATASPSHSGTGTASPSPSQSGTHTATPSPSQSGTATATNTASPSPSQSGTGTATASPSPNGTPLVVRTAALRAPNGAVNPHGHSEWQLDVNGNREIEVEVEDLNLAQGTVLTAFVDGANIGDLTVDDRQKAKLKLRTQNGQSVPVVNDGSTVDVRSGGTVLVAGVFGNGGTPTGTGTNSPSPSQSGTPNNTPSSSQTGTPNNTPSSSQTATPNNTPSPSQTGTGTPNNTPSPSQTGTSTPNNTPSPSETGTSSPSPSATGTPEFRLFAGLSGPTLNGVVPTGFAQFEIHDSRTELEVRVRQVNLAIGTQLGVVVDGNLAGQMTVESGGEGRLRLRSDNGQTVPNVIVGSTITITTGNSAILSGVFGSANTPSPSQTGTPGSTPSPSQTGTPNGTPTPQFGRSFETHLTGNQVVPPVSTAATGEIKVTLSSDSTRATVFGEFHNLSSNQTGAVIQTNTGTPEVILNLGVVGGRNGNFAAVTFQVSAAHVQQLRAGLWSAVITSVNNPTGEIRGNFRSRSRHSDFDGDGLHDFAVFRPSAGMWYTQNTNGFGARSFGSGADRVVSGDFDGDGRTDTAMYCDENGQGVWEIMRSSDAGVTEIAWGLGNDVPLRGDFDGDGRLDVAVYRPSDGMWYIQKSDNTGHVFTHFGVAEDIPVPADMDGDGRDDIVVFRPSLGDWYWLRSSDGQFAAMHFGMTEDIPVTGDFDGDGKNDVTVYRPSTGTWYMTRSSDGSFQATRFGISEDIPVAGNYDDDGRTDIAVFRPSDGNWYVLRSTDGAFQAYHFGLTGDIPAIAR